MDQKHFVTPEWVKDAIFYQIFPDRFAFSQRLIKPNNLESWLSPPTVYGLKGGDLLGIVEHLDYLQDLGVTAIYLNPIFQSPSNHRYHTHDYYHVDPLLGGDSAFKVMRDEMHRRNMRLVLDGVFNHAGRGFFQFNHILETGSFSPYIDWFDIKKFPLNAYQGKPNYRCWSNLPALPEFNTKNPHVRQFIFDVARYWIEQGIDGWRLDVPFCIDDDSFWQEFRQIVKNANPEAYLVGEIPWEAQRWLKGDQFDGVMNYQFTQACLGFFAGKNIDREVEAGMMELHTTRILDASGFAKRANDLLTIYPHEAAYAQLNLLDSHDMPRFITLASEDKPSLQLSILFLMTYPGAPCIYYGDEIGMSSGKGHYPEASHQAFVWDQNQWDHELLNYFRQLITIRKTYPSLRRGEFLTLLAQDQALAFLRKYDQESLIVLINNGHEVYRLEIPEGNLPAGIGDWKRIFGSCKVSISQNHLIRLTLPPRSGCILASQS